MPTITANGTTLYYELRGDGPPLLFISGGPGDAGFWPEVADALADEYTVVSYDRRGNSRSPRPENWTEAPVDEQADDAAALLEALGLAPAVVYGHSAGGDHPGRPRAAAPRRAAGRGLPRTGLRRSRRAAQETSPDSRSASARRMAQGGPSRAMELFLRWADGDEVYESLDPDFRDRMLGDGEVLFGIEMEPITELPCPRPTSSRRSRCPAPSSRAPKP